MPTLDLSTLDTDDRRALEQLGARTTYETVVLIANGRKQGPAQTFAKQLYPSVWFQSARAYAERWGGRWGILSYRHGIIAPDTILEPYDEHPPTRRLDQKAWRNTLLEDPFWDTLAPATTNLIVLAGHPYRWVIRQAVFLRWGHALHAGYPLQHQSFGAQIQWMRAFSKPEADTDGVSRFFEAEDGRLIPFI